MCEIQAAGRRQSLRHWMCHCHIHYIKDVFSSLRWITPFSVIFVKRSSITSVSYYTNLPQKSPGDASISVYEACCAARLLSCCIYRVAQKMAHFLYALTLPNSNRFSKLFHRQNQEKICNNTITKDRIPHLKCVATL